MDIYNQKEVNYNNPKNRFMFCFCKTYEVDKGWGCGWCGCRAFPFSCGIIIFAIIYLVASIKDVVDIFQNNDLKTNNKLFKTFFLIKIGADAICVLGSICALYSLKGRNYCLAVFAYYLQFLSFLLTFAFCIYILTVIFSWDFWSNFGALRLFTLVCWYVLCYFLLIYCWICFCNMVDINRKNNETKKKNQFGFIN